MEYAAKNTFKSSSSLIDRVHDQEILMAECVAALEHVVAKITGNFALPTAEKEAAKNAVDIQSLYGKLNDHEEFLRIVIARLTAATNSLAAGL